MKQELNSNIKDEIRAILGGPERLLTDPADLICYSYDSGRESALPSAVALPENKNQVSRLLALASKHRFPVFPRGAGSGTTGASVPWSGGVALCLTSMNRILEIDPGNLSATVEPGVITGEFQSAVEKQGLFYPPDPASLSFCTIGGNVNTGAGGARAVKYGVTRDYVTALEVVLPTGEIIRTGPNTAKGVAGLDLTRLMVGSEGTLGVVTEINLRLVPMPQSTGTAMLLFRSPAEACTTVKRCFLSGTLPRCIEFFDKASIECISDALPFPAPGDCSAMLLVEVDGAGTSIEPQLDTIARQANACGALRTELAKTQEEAEAMWKARRSMSPSIKKLGYSGKVSEDICVPRNRLPEAVEALEQISRDFNTRIVSFGHAGDGNLHVNILFDKNNPKDVENMEHTVKAVMECALRLGGTISGEHGIGLSKREFMRLEADPVRLKLMAGIKKLFDPHGIMNPGKMYPV